MKMKKKLTDEEIVKAYECCYMDNLDCEECPCDSWGCGVTHEDILDLIQRLQAKYRNLEINYNDVYEQYRKLELENPKLKAEIERLKMANEELYYNGLNENTARLGDMKTIERLQDRNAELQKQVDELKAELEKAYKTERANIQAEIADCGAPCHWCRDLTVKDTAKEILQEVADKYSNNVGYTDWFEDEYFGVAVACLLKKYGLTAKMTENGLEVE